MTMSIAKRNWRSRLTSCAWLVCTLLLTAAVWVTPVNAQGTTPQAAAPQPADPPPLSKEQLEQVVAPIALYPDDLLSQVLMASTYPLEVVQAARWASQNPNVKGKALEDAMAKQSWDPSVKGLVAVPQTLQMMSDKLDWTQQLGDAFLDDQGAVLDAVQRLRQKAEGTGNLKTSPQMKVSKVSNTTPSSGGQPVERIIVERADPAVAYVPVYDPNVVYGAWPYPAYPPYYYQPPGWIPGTFAYGALAFGASVAVGAAIWGGANWWGAGGGNVAINANRYNSFNRTNISGGNWNHNGAHRGSVPYRNNAAAQKFGGQSAGNRAGNRQGAGGAGGAGNRQGLGGQGGAGQKGAGAGSKGGGGQKGAGSKGGGGQKSAGKGGGGGQKGAGNRGGGGGNKAASKGGGNRSANRGSQGAARSGNVSRGGGGGARMGGGGGGMHRAAGGMGGRGGGGMRMGGGGGGRGGGGRGGGRRSDITVKHDIAYLGQLDNGLGFYRFTYNGSDKAYVGVMAQEVQVIRPDAVSRDAAGILRVHYDRLGVRFQTYDRWLREGAHVPARVMAH